MTSSRDAARPTPPPASRRVCTSDELFAGAREVVIRHGRDEYRLSITRAGKLILTK